MAEINITGLSFFMPIFSFLFVFIIVYAILAKTHLLGEGKFLNVVIGFIIAIIFISFSTATFSTEQYVRTIIPWFAVLLVCVFLVLLLAGLSAKDLGVIMKPGFAWAVIAILIIIFVLAAIRVFNPVFSSQYGVDSGQGGQFISQIGGIFNNEIGGSILLLIIAIIVAWVITRK